MSAILARLLSVAGTSGVGLFLTLASPRIMATIIVLIIEPISARTSWEWDNKLLKVIKEEWKV